MTNVDILVNPEDKGQLIAAALCCPLQDGICTCGPGFTEVFLHSGQLNQCAPIPILEIPTWEDKKGDVKTIRAIDTPSPTPVLPGLPGRTWYLQPYGPGQNPQHVISKLFFLLSLLQPAAVVAVVVVIIDVHDDDDDDDVVGPVTPCPSLQMGS